MKNHSIRHFLLASGLALSGCAANPNQESSPDQNSTSFAPVWNAFSLYDSNSDGYIDQHEFNQFRKDPQALSRLSRGSGSTLMFNEIDENQDNRISEQELTTAIQSQN